MRRLAGAAGAVAAAILLLGCGQSPSTVQAGSGRCGTRVDKVDHSKGDDAPLHPGFSEFTSPLYAAGTTDDTFIEHARVVAVVTAVGREAGYAKRAGKIPAVETGREWLELDGSTSPDYGTTVVRIVTFAVDRVVKGDARPCMTFDVPRTDDGYLYPRRIRVGSRFALFVSEQHDGSLVAMMFVPFDEQGRGRLPFGRVLDADTWSAADLSPQAARPAPRMSEPTVPRTYPPGPPGPTGPRPPKTYPLHP